MSNKREASETFFSTLSMDGSKIPNMLTKLYLPRKLTDDLVFQFSPTDDQAQMIRSLLFWKFSLRGEVKSYDGSVEKQIVADIVISNSINTKPLGFGITEHEFDGEPADLTITHYLNHGSENQKVLGKFWITPSRVLGPDYVSTHSYTGDVSIETARSFDFKVSSDLHFKFENYHKRYRGPDGDLVSFHELVADFELEGKTIEDPELYSALVDLDDVLLLASLASRSRCICLGWDAYDFQTMVTRYLRNRTLPKTDDSKGNDYNDLIGVTDFPDFMATSFKHLREYAEPQALCRTLNFIVPNFRSTTDANFVMLYSALEMMVLHFRRQNGLEFILETGEFNRFRKQIKGAIDNSEIVTSDLNKLEIKGKLSELNRISFASAFQAFCEFYALDLSDLWPINNSLECISLSQIRNRLVHGEHFDSKDYDRLVIAREHLRWIVERMVLRILGWPVEKSHVSPGYLLFFNPYKIWRPLANNSSS